MMSGRLEDDRSAAEGGEVHDVGSLQSEPLHRRYLWIRGGGTHRRLRRGVMPVHGIPNDLRPHPNRSTRLRLVGGREDADEVDGALRDRVEIVIMRSARSGVKRLARSECFELTGAESAFVISVEQPDSGPR